MPRIKLSEFKARHQEADGVDIELDDGTVVHLPPPILWPDEAYEVIRTQRLEDLDATAVTRLVLGADQHARYIADGGTSASLLLMLREQQNVGEAQASPASSEATTARPSRPTSSGTTESTSSTPAPSASHGDGSATSSTDSLETPL